MASGISRSAATASLARTSCPTIAHIGASGPFARVKATSSFKPSVNPGDPTQGAFCRPSPAPELQMPPLTRIRPQHPPRRFAPALSLLLLATFSSTVIAQGADKGEWRLYYEASRPERV